MEEKTIEALKWIVDILNKLEVPYRVGGGFAAHVYGSERSINDVAFFHPLDMIAYKKELDGPHQRVDIEALQKYVDAQ